MSNPDFFCPAEIFIKSKTSGWARSPIKYRRFDNLSSAVQFAMDEYGTILNGIAIHTETDEYTGYAIRSLYESDEYPLVRKAAVQRDARGAQSSPTRKIRARSHKFKLGDNVVFSHPGLKGRGALYEIGRILPTENAEPAYRIKGKGEQHERAVKEHEISLA